MKAFYSKNVAPGADRANTDAEDQAPVVGRVHFSRRAEEISPQQIAAGVQAAAAAAAGGAAVGGADGAPGSQRKDAEERKYMSELLQHDSTRFDPAVRRTANALWNGIRERFGDRLNFKQYMMVFMQISKSLADSDNESSDEEGGGSNMADAHSASSSDGSVHSFKDDDDCADAAKAAAVEAKVAAKNLKRDEKRCAKTNKKEDRIHAAIMADWEFDSGGKGFVNKSDFIESVMQLTASWARQDSAENYFRLSAHCFAQLWPEASFLLSALRFHDRSRPRRRMITWRSSGPSARPSLRCPRRKPSRSRCLRSNLRTSSSRRCGSARTASA